MFGFSHHDTKDDQAQRLLIELALTNANDKGYTLQNGLIRYKGRLWLGNHEEAHRAVLLALHTGAIGGHSGVLGTYHRVKKLFY